MSHTPHELTEEFPEQAEKIRALKVADAHFARLSEEYHEINRVIHRAETNVEPTDDFNYVQMCKTRLRLKDEIAGCLSRACGV